MNVPRWLLAQRPGAGHQPHQLSVSSAYNGRATDSAFAALAGCRTAQGIASTIGRGRRSGSTGNARRVWRAKTEVPLDACPISQAMTMRGMVKSPRGVSEVWRGMFTMFSQNSASKLARHVRSIPDRVHLAPYRIADALDGACRRHPERHAPPDTLADWPATMNFPRRRRRRPARRGAPWSSSPATAAGASGASARWPIAAPGWPGAPGRHGVGRGDVVMTLIGNRPEWVLTMVACFRIGAVALACNEQLRAKDLRQRLDAARPKPDRRRRAQPGRALRRPTGRARS